MIRVAGFILLTSLSLPSFADELASDEVLKCSTYNDVENFETTYTLRIVAEDRIVFVRTNPNPEQGDKMQENILGVFEACVQYPDNKFLIACRTGDKNAFQTRTNQQMTIAYTPKGRAVVTSSQHLTIVLPDKRRPVTIDLDASECLVEERFGFAD
jgi:hypothetical protein